MAIQEPVARKLLYHLVGGRRFTQDTPIMPDVWVAYAKDATAPRDLILTPTRDTPAGRVAKKLRDLLREYRAKDHVWKPLAKVAKVRPRLTHLPGQITARVYFDELMRIVLAVTPWWKLRPQKVRDRRDSPLFGFPDPNDGDEERMLESVVEALERSRRPIYGGAASGTAERDELPPDLLWVVRLAGAIALSCEEEGQTFGDSKVLHPFQRSPYEECLEEYLQPAEGDEEREQKCLSLTRLLAHGFLELYREWPIKIPPKGSLLWRVTLNRECHAAIYKSSLTVKADAARLLFEISSKKITWAIVDSGIDRDHPAFLDHEAEEEPEEGPTPLPHGPAGTGATEDPADSSWAWGTTPPRKKNASRVDHTFDFRQLRDLLDPEVIEALLQPKGEGSDSPPPDAELAAEAEKLRQVLESRRQGNRIHEEELRQEGLAGEALERELEGRNLEDLLQDIQQLRARIEAGHEIDWGLLERFIEDHSPEVPRNEHGTHVAGILGADWRDSGDDSKVIMKGICPDVRMMDLRVLRDDGRSDEFEVMAALQYLRYRNSRAGYMDVHGANLSLSIRHDVANYACGRTPVCEECEEGVAVGMVIVAAAGNQGFVEYQTRGGVVGGYSTVSVTDPGNAEAVITVGSTHRTRPHEYGVSYFSSRGPTGDGRIKPDLVAPGEKVKGPVPGGGSTYKDGTSMAAPHVSGAAVLLMARHKELIGRPARIKQILCDTGTDLGRERYFQGAGLLDILRALQSL